MPPPNTVQPAATPSTFTGKRIQNPTAKRMTTTKTIMQTKRASPNPTPVPPENNPALPAPSSQPPQPTTSESIANQETTNRLIEKFTKMITTFATIPCDKLLYPRRVRNFTITEAVKSKFLLLGSSFELNSILSVCDRCHSHLSSGKVSPQALANKMELSPIPPEISRLSATEIRLISQVNSFMKLFLLCNGAGQKAMKGMVIHFPQNVDEVAQQLPLNG